MMTLVYHFGRIGLGSILLFPATGPRSGAHGERGQERQDVQHGLRAVRRAEQQDQMPNVIRPHRKPA